MKNVYFAFLAVLMIASAALCFAGNTDVNCDFQYPDHEMKIWTAEDTTKGWNFYLFDEGASWTNYAGGGATGQLYYAAAYTSATWTVISSTNFSTNLVVMTPTASQVATSGTYKCQLILDDGTDRIEAGRGELEIKESFN